MTSKHLGKLILIGIVLIAVFSYVVFRAWGGTFIDLTLTSNASLANGLVGHWSFDGKDTSTTTASDISGQGNNGTLNGQPAIPVYRSSGTFTNGAGTIAPPYPTDFAVNDVCLLVVESENEAISLSSAQGFVEVSNSPQSAGTAITNPANRIAVFWKRAVGSDTAPTVADSGNHTTGQIHCFKGVVTSGSPWDITAGGNDGGVNDTSGLIPGATTAVANTLVVLVQGTSYNATSAVQCSGWTNANLANLTERTDNTNTIALGGGHCMATGEKAAAGNYGDTTVTLANTTFKGAISIALSPSGIATVPGRIGQALSFDGVDDFVSVPSSSAFDFSATGGFSYFTWFKKDTTCSSPEGTTEVFANRFGSSDGVKTWWFGCATGGATPGKLGIDLIPGGVEVGGYVHSQNAVNDGVWHHGGWVYDGSANEVRLYLDGVLQGASTTAFTVSFDVANPICLGSYDALCSAYESDGLFDDVRVYNRALSTTEISRLYNLGATTHIDTTLKTNPTLEQGLVGHWSFDGGTEAVVSGGIIGDCYDGVNFDTYVSKAKDTTVNFDPADTTLGINRANGGETFSCRWEGFVKATYSETYTFYVTSDDGVRLWVNEQPLVDAWIPQGPTEYSGTVTLTAGQWYPIKLEFYEDSGDSTITLSYSSASETKKIIPSTNLGNRTFSDKGSGGNTGESYGASIASGRIGQALSFDGVGDYVDVQSPSSLDNFTAFTYCTWIYPETMGESNDATFIFKGTTATPKKMLGFDSGGTLEFVIVRATTDATAYSTDFSLNEWQQVCGKYDETDGPRLYRNGAEVSYSTTRVVGSGGTTSDGSDVVIIGNRQDGSRTFDGPMDDVRIYSRALSAAEISRLYNLGATTHINTTLNTNPNLDNGLIGHWSFDGKDTSIVLSESFSGSTFPPTTTCTSGWTTGGNANWTRDTGTSNTAPASANSGVITGDLEGSWIECVVSVSVPSTLSFNWKVSSESTYDFLHLCIDQTSTDCDGVYDTGYDQRISGEVNWTTVTKALSAGTHTLRWLYAKDESATGGTDEGWIDDISIDAYLATDRSGQGNTGTSTGAFPAIGRIGQALSFDGVDDYVDVGDNSSLQLTGAMTVSAWVNTSSASYNGRIVSKVDWTGTPNKGWELAMEGNSDITFYLKDSGGTNYAVNVTAQPTEEWRHYVAVYKPSTSMEMYVNGVSGAINTTSIPSAIANSDYPAYIGGRPDNSCCRLTGTIDDVRIYNRALSATEILRLYQLGK